MKIRLFDPRTQEKFEAFHTEELSAELEAARRNAQCQHENRQVIRAKIKNGGIQIKEACPTCGETLGNALKQEPKHNSALELNLDALKEEYGYRLFLQLKEILLRHKKEQNQYDTNWWKEYKEYLRSEKWKEKRELKLRQQNFLCEGCGKARAVEVHHISYRYVPFEMLFDLQALCVFCHDMMHLDKAGRERYWVSKSADDLPCCGCRYSTEEFGRAWCGVHDIPAEVSLISDKYCGPTRSSLEPLK